MAAHSIVDRVELVARVRYVLGRVITTVTITAAIFTDILSDWA